MKKTQERKPTRLAGEKAFQQWYRDLGNFHYEFLACDPLAAFQFHGFYGDEDEAFKGFHAAWNRRFDLQYHLPPQVEHFGWYLVYMAKALELAHTMRQGALESGFRGHLDHADQLLKRLHDCYGQRGYRGEPVMDSTPALVRFEVRGDCKYLTVADACLAHFDGPLGIYKNDGYLIPGSFYIADKTDRFHITVNSPETVEFQRAARMLMDFPLSRLNLEPQAFPRIMSWVFAGGYQNVLSIAEDAISHRGQTTYSEGRRVLRQAMGIGKLTPADREQ